MVTDLDYFFTDEHKMFRETTRRFVERDCPIEYARECDQKRQYPYEFYGKMVKQGLMGLIIPEEYGGVGADHLFQTILCEALAKYAYDIGAGYCLIAWGIRNILKHGTTEQKSYYLPKVLKGEQRFSISITEPNAGSDAAALTTFATLQGDHFIVNGQKVFSTAADSKDNTIVMAVRTDKSAPKHKGISLLLVDNTLKGITFRRLDSLARRILGTNEVFLEDVKVPKENLLGNLNEGWGYLTEHLAMERAEIAALYVGNAQNVVDTAVRYAKERNQFGRPIGQFQVIKHMLVDSQLEVDAARLLTYRCAWLVTQGQNCIKEAAMAKLYASETLWKVSVNAMQILGGYAQMPEYDVERYFRDAKQSTVGGGTSQIQRGVIAKYMGL